MTKSSVNEMSKAELDRYRDDLVAFFQQRGIDGEPAVTLLLMSAAQVYLQLMRDEGYRAEGFVDTATVAFNVARGGIPS